MTSLRFGYYDIDSQLRLFGTEDWVLTYELPAGAIHSALIYDDEAVIRYIAPNGHLIISTTSLWRGWQDVLEAIKLRLIDSTSPTGYTYIPFSFARGTPDLTPVKLVGTKGDDVLYGGMGADVLKGVKGNDILHGERTSDNHWVGGDDKLIGGSGDDRLIGHEDKNQLYGGSGEDWLDGGQGNDVLTGGKGADIFHIHLKYEAVAQIDGTPRQNHDRVTDFELGIDKIGLVSSQYHDAELQIETQSSNGLVTGTRVSISQWAGHNSLSVRFDTAVTQAEFNDYADDAGGLNAFLLEVV